MKQKNSGNPEEKVNNSLRAWKWFEIGADMLIGVERLVQY